MDRSNKVLRGIYLGILAGIIDVTPMILQGLTWDANVSAFAHWIIAGLFISTSNMEFRPVLKGLTISFLLLVPVGILVGWNEPMSVLPMAIMTLILGSLLGYFIER
jgi:threonine/homoserine efflux transporter RhtA